jgi:dienelactone hydrolase
MKPILLLAGALAMAATPALAADPRQNPAGAGLPEAKWRLQWSFPQSLDTIHGAADPIAPKAERDAFEAEMEAAGVRWALLTWGGVVHAFTDIGVNVPGVAVYDEAVSRHGFAFAHAFIADAFAGQL